MMPKLHVNLSQGLIEIDGDPEFIREILSELRPIVLEQSVKTFEQNDSDNEAEGVGGTKKKRAVKRKAVKKTNSESSGIDPDNPTLDKDLDTQALGEFYAQFKPKNHAENILTFLMFLNEKLGLKNANTNQIYTCYLGAKVKPPRAFYQALRDTSSKRYGYINIHSPESIEVSTVGNNYFQFDLKKAEDE